MSAAQDGEALRDFEDFFKLVGYKEDRDAARLQVGDDVEEGAHFLLGEGGRGLVHDDEFRVAHECAADGDELFVGDGEVADEFVEVDMEANFGDGFAGDFAHARAVDEAASGGDFAAERDVLHDGEVGEDGEVLVDDAHACVDGGGRRQARKVAAPDRDRPVFGGVHARNDLDERGFARPVFSGQAVDFSGRDVEVDVDQGSHACEGFADVSYRQHWGVHVVSFPTHATAQRPPPRARASRAGGTRMRERPCTRGSGPATASSMERGTRPWSLGGRRLFADQKPRESTLSFVILSQPVPSRTLVEPDEKCMLS